MNFFYKEEDYRKPKFENNDFLYRKAVVIDSNRKDEFMVVKLTTKGKKFLETYSNGKSKYKPFIETLDDKGEPIKIKEKKFELNPETDIVPMKEVNKIKKDVFTKTSKSLRRSNLRKARKLKGRK